MIRKETIKEYYERENIVKGYHKDYEQTNQYYKIISALDSGSKVLSLGCGGGREVKLLTKLKHKVTAVDFSKPMIEQSKKLAPKATYFCEDAVDFAERNRNKTQFDYILGLFTFLCYIDGKKRARFVENVMSMLKPDGIAIFTVHYIDNNIRDFIKSLIAPPFALYYQGHYEFGDTCFNLFEGKCTLAHHFTHRQIRKLFSKYNLVIKDNKVLVSHHAVSEKQLASFLKKVC